MTFRTVIDALTEQSDALRVAVEAKKETLDAAEAVAVASAAVVVGKQPGAKANAATAAAKATEATNNATQIAAYKTAAAALDTSTTATAAVTNLLPDLLAKKDPARHPFRKKMPTLVLDFERQKCHRYSPSTGFGETPLNTFMTFARNSTATYTGPDGLLKTAAANEPRYDYDPLTGECKGLLVEEQRTNLVGGAHYMGLPGNPMAHNITATTQAKPSAFVSVDGTLTAVDITDVGTGDDFAYKSVDITSGTTTYAASVFFRKTVGATVRPSLFVVLLGGTTAASNCIINTNTGAALGVGTVEDFGAYWKVTTVVTDNASGNNTCYFRIYPAFNLVSDGNSTARNDHATGTVTICCSQLEIGAFKTSYIKSIPTFTGRASTATYLDANGVVQTAASGVARSAAYDYDSDGVLRPIGLLLEASATNQLLYSEQFDKAAWMKNLSGAASAPVVTANYGVAPDGTTTADRVVFAMNGATTIGDRSELAQSCTTIAGSTYTQSIWLKTVDGSTKQLQLSYDNENPKIVTVTGTWQRFSNTGTASDTIRGFRLALRGTTGTSDSADVLIWGAQQGVGSYPTSYIPTTTAQVTRAADTSTSAQATRVADDAKVDGTKFSDFYNQTQGTLVARGNLSDVTAGTPVSRTLVCVAGALDNLRVGSSSMGAVVLTNNAVIEAGNGSLWAQTAGAHAISVRIKKDDFATTRDGAAVTTDTSCATPRVDIVRIGTTGINSGVLNGHVSRISYYPQPFTNEELQAATSA